MYAESLKRFHSRGGGNPFQKNPEMRRRMTGFPPSREWPMLQRKLDPN